MQPDPRLCSGSGSGWGGAGDGGGDHGFKGEVKEGGVRNGGG
jgi:hypothetical protein